MGSGIWRRVEYLLGAGVWVAAIIYFWHWWLQPANHTYLVGSILVTAILAWVTLLPAYFIFLFFRARRPVGPLNLPAGSRITMVVTKAPSEPFGVVAETLRAMLAQNVPHDTWLADEDPSPETLAWCREHGVFVSTRRGRADYHLHTWPRRTRCKEGNLAFFMTITGTSAMISSRSSMPIMFRPKVIFSRCCARLPIRR